MGARPIWTVFCDGEDCVNWCEESQAPRASMSVASARRAGWVRRKGSDGKTIDLCPDCLTPATRAAAAKARADWMNLHKSDPPDSPGEAT